MHGANPKHAGIKPAATRFTFALRPVAAGFMPACFGLRTVSFQHDQTVVTQTAESDAFITAGRIEIAREQDGA